MKIEYFLTDQNRRILHRFAEMREAHFLNDWASAAWPLQAALVRQFCPRRRRHPEKDLESQDRPRRIVVFAATRWTFPPRYFPMRS